MNRILLNILIVLLVLTPIGVIFYFYSGNNTTTTVSNQVTQNCEDQSILYFGLRPPIEHISLSIEDNYFYTSFGASKNYLDTNTQYKSYN